MALWFCAMDRRAYTVSRDRWVHVLVLYSSHVCAAPAPGAQSSDRFSPGRSRRLFAVDVVATSARATVSQPQGTAGGARTAGGRAVSLHRGRAASSTRPSSAARGRAPRRTDSQGRGCGWATSPPSLVWRVFLECYRCRRAKGHGEEHAGRGRVGVHVRANGDEEGGREAYVCPALFGFRVRDRRGAARSRGRDRTRGRSRPSTARMVQILSTHRGSVEKDKTTL
ncbi:hypothetical protein BV25DRAFT_1531690 [Artomyces pyxidatus]|uniref:Uncharacterized protein n=1 Tax=Artomyces pyxidatus TaxID=48021 RepID=A0ACB8TCM8_9AGAM|nr:hypothetical protein BV25DRAFT_1531690 [Artomyces pyxidatus]